MRAHSVIGRLAEADPDAQILSSTVTGTVDIPKFPTDRPRVKVEFFRPARGGLHPGQSPGDFASGSPPRSALGRRSIGGRKRSRQLARMSGG